MTNQLQHQPRRADYRIPAIEKYAYCLCLHVKPTTIFIAVFILIRAIFASVMLSSTEFEQVNDLGLTIDERHRSTTAAVNVLTRTIMGSVSAVGIYGVISGRAALLMPLYAILLVDFFFALPAFYNRELDPSLTDSLADFRNHITGSNQYTRYSVMLFSTITMIVKIYFLCVIWKCYRYLRLIELVSPIRLSEIYPHIHQGGSQYPIVRVLSSGDSTDLGSGHNVAPPPYDSIASTMKPPNYEEAMKSSSMSFAANPPPPAPVATISQLQANDTVVISPMENMITTGSSGGVVVVEPPSFSPSSVEGHGPNSTPTRDNVVDPALNGHCKPSDEDPPPQPPVTTMASINTHSSSAENSPASPPQLQHVVVTPPQQQDC